MARSRILKPSFFLNEQLASFSAGARLLFAGLWCLADRKGRLEDRPLRIKAEIFPYDTVSPVEIDRFLQSFHDASLVIRYQSGQKAYIQVVNFEKHQRPHPRETESIIPPPPPSTNGKSRAKAFPSRVKVLSSPSISVSNSVSNSDSTPLVVSPEVSSGPLPLHQGSRPEIPYTEFVGLWNSNAGSLPRVHELTDKRRQKIRGRWLERQDLAYWKGVVQRMSKSKFCSGGSDRGWIADFDWLISNDTNHVKVMEGKYDDRGGANGHANRQSVSTYAAIAKSTREREGLRAVGDTPGGTVLDRFRNLHDAPAKTDAGS